MYEGTNKTALTSQRAIADCLISLMKEKSYSSISISELCKQAGVSRQTFYSLFSGKDDVISYELEKRYCFRPEDHSCCCKSMTLHNICHAYSMYISQKQEFLALLVHSDIMYLMQNSLYRSFMDCRDYLPDHSEQDRVYAADFIAGGLTCIARNYVLHDSKRSSDHLEQIIYTLFSGSLFEE